MYATLLLPPGLTSVTSIMYKDEEKILDRADDPELEYVSRVLPDKMKYNLEEILKIGIFYNTVTLLKTVKAIIF